MSITEQVRTNLHQLEYGETSTSLPLPSTPSLLVLDEVKLPFSLETNNLRKSR